MTEGQRYAIRMTAVAAWVSAKAEWHRLIRIGYRDLGRAACARALVEAVIAYRAAVDR